MKRWKAFSGSEFGLVFAIKDDTNLVGISMLQAKYLVESRFRALNDELS